MFSTLKGKTIRQITGTEAGSLRVSFLLSDCTKWDMYHMQDCCESVSLEDITGDINDILNSPILLAEEVTSTDNPKNRYDESFTWTFYKLSTIKGSVTIRWYGESNGYYSEDVSFIQDKSYKLTEEW